MVSSKEEPFVSLLDIKWRTVSKDTGFLIRTLSKMLSSSPLFGDADFSFQFVDVEEELSLCCCCFGCDGAKRGLFGPTDVIHKGEVLPTSL